MLKNQRIHESPFALYPSLCGLLLILYNSALPPVIFFPLRNGRVQSANSSKLKYVCARLSIFSRQIAWCNSFMTFHFPVLAHCPGVAVPSCSFLKHALLMLSVLHIASSDSSAYRGGFFIALLIFVQRSGENAQLSKGTYIVQTFLFSLGY